MLKQSQGSCEFKPVLTASLNTLSIPVNSCWFVFHRWSFLSVRCGLAPVRVAGLARLNTVVPALGDPRRERPPAVCGHFVNVPTHFKVKLPVISGHLPNADADSHLLVVSTCYNGQCKQMPRFRWSFQPKIAGAHPNLRPKDLSNFRVVVW